MSIKNTITGLLIGATIAGSALFNVGCASKEDEKIRKEPMTYEYMYDVARCDISNSGGSFKVVDKDSDGVADLIKDGTILFYVGSNYVAQNSVEKRKVEEWILDGYAREMNYELQNKSTKFLRSYQVLQYALNKAEFDVSGKRYFVGGEIQNDGTFNGKHLNLYYADLDNDDTIDVASFGGMIYWLKPGIENLLTGRSYNVKEAKEMPSYLSDAATKCVNARTELMNALDMKYIKGE
ncbi:MAG: hypothetical protein WC758_00885 [Candidatus Woesearchaeota archaeon]|jgi:hypothetical protein